MPLLRILLQISEITRRRKYIHFIILYNYNFTKFKNFIKFNIYYDILRYVSES